MFHNIWKEQKDFSDEVIEYFYEKETSELTHQERIIETKDSLLSLMGECKETLDELNWKRHRRPKKEFHRDSFVEELIDIQKYLWNIFAIWGISFEEFEEAFSSKSAIVRQRWVDEIL